MKIQSLMRDATPAFVKERATSCYIYHSPQFCAPARCRGQSKRSGRLFGQYHGPEAGGSGSAPHSGGWTRTSGIGSWFRTSRKVTFLWDGHWCQHSFLFFLHCVLFFVWVAMHVVLRRVSIRTLREPSVALCRLGFSREVDAASFRPALL